MTAWLDRLAALLDEATEEDLKGAARAIRRRTPESFRPPPRPLTSPIAHLAVGESTVIHRVFCHYDRAKARLMLGAPDAQWKTRRLGSNDIRTKVTRIR
jgi:hypothetical protein